MLDRIRAWRDAYLDWRERRFADHRRRYYGELRVVDDRLEHWRRGETRFSFGHDQIMRVEFYKVDQFTTDCITCDITLENSRIWTIDEECSGWKEALPWIESLPGFRRDWWEDVARPAFAECRQVVFIRGQRVY